MNKNNGHLSSNSGNGGGDRKDNASGASGHVLNHSHAYKSHSLKMRNQQMTILKEYYQQYERDLQRQAEKEAIRQERAPPLPIKSADVRMDIKHFSRVLAAILESNQAHIEEELWQMTLRKNITYDEFRQFQREFMDGLYANPSHPLDMHVSQLNEIRKDFEEAALRAKDSHTNTNGIPIDGFSQILARKMNMDPSRIQKFFQRSAFFSSITWNEFQAMLDKESTIREELLDWFMHRENINNEYQNEYSLEPKSEECLKPRERTSQRNFVIESMIEMKIGSKSYFLVIFDEATLALYEANTFQSALEFTIPQEIAKANLLEKGAHKRQTPTDDTGQSMAREPASSTTITQNSQYSSPTRRPISSRGRGPTKQRLYSATAEKNASNKHSPDNSYTRESSIKSFARQASVTVSGFINANTSTSDDRRKQQPRQNQLQRRVSSATKRDSIMQSQRFIDIQLRERNTLDQSSMLLSMGGNKGRRSSKMKDDSYNSEEQKTNTNNHAQQLEQSYMVSTNFQTTNRTDFKRASSGIFEPGDSSITAAGAGGGGVPSEFAKTPRNTKQNAMRQSQNNTISYTKAERDSLMGKSQILNISTMQHRGSGATMGMGMGMGGFRPQSGNEKSSLRRDVMTKNNVNSNSNNGNIGFQDEGLYKMEEDPDFSKIMKIYLTSEVKDDDDRKKISVSFDVFYQMYKREPWRFPYSGGASVMSSTDAEKEEYIGKDAETKETVSRLWKKFHQLPRDFSIAYAKAVNEIISEKNLKNVNQENLKMLFKKAVHISTNAVSSTIPIQKSVRSSSLALPYKNSQSSTIRKKLDANWKSQICKRQLQEIQNIDQHININPWTCELRKSPEQKMPAFLKDIQAGIERRMVAAKERAQKIKNGLKRSSHHTISLSAQSNDDNNQDLEDEAREELLMQEGDGSKSTAPQVKNRRNNRMKVFSVQYLEELNILALGMINRQLQIYSAFHEKNQVKVHKVYSYQFNEVIVGIAFRLNVVTKKWNIALLFENDVLRIYEFVVNERDGKLLAFDHFYTYEFRVEIDRIQLFPEFGFVITSSKGHFFVFQDHLTSSNSSDEVKSIPQYYIDQEKRLFENGTALSITAIACCENHKLILFGTSKGKISFYEVKTREFLGVKDAGSDAILSLHIFQKQNQLISICRDQLISVWDIAKRTQVYSFRAIEDRYDEGNGKITASIYVHEFDQLMLASNNLKVWEMKVNKELLFKERKMQQLYEWRNKDMEKQENYLRIEGEKIKYMHKQMTQNWVLDKPPVLQKATSASMMNQQMQNQRYQQMDAQHRSAVVMRQVIRSKEVIVTWDSNSEMRILSKKTLKTKYSFMLSAPEDDKIEHLDILDNKILAMCTEKGDVYLKNLYTEDQCQKITEYEGYPLKLSQLLFLPADCQMSLAASSQEGKVLFLNSYLKKKTSKKYIIIPAHKKRIITMVSNHNNTMISAAEDNILNIFSLRSCSSIYKIELSNVATTISRQFVQQICFSNDKDKNCAFIVMEQGQVLEVNCNDGNILSQLKQQVGKFSRIEVDSLGKTMLSIDEDLNISFYTKNTPASNFALLKTFQVNLSSSPMKSRNGIVDNDSWTPLPSISINLKKDALFENDIQCINVLYDEEASQFSLFINHRGACIINLKTKTKRYFTYSTGELHKEDPIRTEGEATHPPVIPSPTLSLRQKQ